MRMAADHLVRDGFDNIAEAKLALFFSHAGMKHHLKQQIAKLFTEIIGIVALNGI
ncbi:hypothetical protein FQZ97_980820 [compost metagenome]